MAILVALAVSAAADVARGADVDFPGYYAAFGFVGCVVIILASKWLGKHWLQRPEGGRPPGHAGPAGDGDG